MTACGACRKRFERQRQAPPCAECSHRPPRLLAENVGIWRLWIAVRTQWRVGFGGPVGLDYGALYLVAGTLGMTLTAEHLQRIQRLEAVTLEMANDDKDND